MSLPRTFQDKLLSALAQTVTDITRISDDRYEAAPSTHEMVVRYGAGPAPTSGTFYVQRGWKTDFQGYFNFEYNSFTFNFTNDGAQHVLAYDSEDIEQFIKEFTSFVSKFAETAVKA